MITRFAVAARLPGPSSTFLAIVRPSEIEVMPPVVYWEREASVTEELEDRFESTVASSATVTTADLVSGTRN